jgi:hypothetical protein
MKESTMKKVEKGQLEVFGATILGFAQACINLNIVAGGKAGDIIKDIQVDQWYPFDRLKEIESVVIESYDNAAPIMERVGMQMMFNWYNHGPGKDIIDRGVDFLEFQTGSQGYASVVKGPEETVGNFNLVELNEAEGKARVHSTTPWNKDMERGVIIGGMSAPGDLDYIDVVNEDDEHVFDIEFF